MAGTVDEILNDPRELWMNSPVNYPYAERIEKSDMMGLKRFLLQTTPDEEAQEFIRQMDHKQVIKALLDSHFTFDEEWLGARLLPETDMSTWKRLSY